MPIGEAHKSGSRFSGLCEYVLAQGIYDIQNELKKPEIVLHNYIYGEDYEEIAKQFKEQADENRKVKNPVMHLSVNFKTEDHISEKVQKEFVKRVLDEMGIKDDNHQYIAVRHNDKHPHFHIVVNRVGFDGKTLSDSHSKYRIGTACDKVEKEMGLDNYLEKSRVFIYDEATNSYKKNENREINKGKAIVKRTRNREAGVQEKKDYIQIQTIKALQNIKISSLETLQNELKKKSIEFQFIVNKKEQVAVSFKYDGLAVKGTQVSLKGSLIKKQLLLNKNASKIQNKKDGFLNTISETKAAFRNSINEMVNCYNSGKMPNLKEVFFKNGLKLDDDFTIKHNNWEVKIPDLQSFNEHCKMKLGNAKKEYENKLQAYESLQKTEFKKGFLGILTVEQKKYNEELKIKKENIAAPSLDVGISAETFLRDIQSKMEKIHKEIQAEKVDHEQAYIIDKSIDLEQRKELKEEPLANLSVLNSSSAIEDEEMQKPKKKRSR